MRLGSEERLVPSRATSASREVARSRQHVDAARRSLELAVEMYSGADGEAAGAPVSALEHVLGQLEEAEAALWEASQ
jgi:hypothetical protein